MFGGPLKKFVPNLILMIWIVAFLLAFRRLDVLWLSLGTISFLLMLGVSKVHDVPRLKWELITFLMVPLFLGMTGISRSLEGVLYGVDIALVVITPAIGFMIVFNMHYHTELRVNMPFSIFFVVIFSLASGALIGIGEFMSDKYLGTLLLESNYDLMVDLMVITAAAVIMGVLFRNYLRASTYGSLRSMTDFMDADVDETKNAFFSILYSGFGTKGFRWAVVLSVVMQASMVLFSIYAFISGNLRWFVSGIFCLGATMVPSIYTRNTKVVLPPLLHLWICVALFLHVFGGTMGYYSDVWWWDHLTHFISGSLISILGFTVLVSIARLSKTLYIPALLVPVFILLFILATGVVWEIFEFFSDTVFGTGMQYSLEDTVYDMIYNIYGGIFASVIGYRYFLSEHRKL